MASYAQPSDLQQIQPNITSTQAEWLLTQASATIDSYLWPGRRDSSLLAASGLVLDTWTGVDRLRSHGNKTLLLGLPTSAVTSVAVEGEGATIPPYPPLPVQPNGDPAWKLRTERNVLERVDGSYWPGGTGATIYYPLGGSASLSPMGVVVPGAYACVLVSRTRGYTPGYYPAEIVTVCVTVALRLATATGLLSEKLGDYEYTLRKGDPTQLTSAEIDILTQYATNQGEVVGA